MRYLLTCCALLGGIVAVPIASGSGSTTAPEIEMEDFSFRPARMIVRPRALVVWKNRDRAPHNAVSLARSAGRPLFRTRTTGFRGEVTARAPAHGAPPAPLRPRQRRTTSVPRMFGWTVQRYR